MRKYFMTVAFLLSPVAMAETNYFFCQYSGLTLKSGGQAAIVSNIFAAEDEDTAEDMFKVAVDEEYDYYRDYAFCRSASGDRSRLESDRNTQLHRSEELNVQVLDVVVGQPVSAILTDENKYGAPLYWQCSYISFKDKKHYFSTVAPIPHQPNKSYPTVASEALAGFGDFLSREYGVNIGEGGSCTGAPMRDETERVHERGKEGAREAKYKVIQTEWKPMDAPMPR